MVFGNDLHPVMLFFLHFVGMQDTILIVLLLSLLSILIIGLIAEKIIHNQRIKSIPLRISVSGTRGKTTVVRLLAGILRESGRVVISKTTGTEARYILPDGTEEDVRRRGLASILEQKKLIKKAVRLKANCLVTEIMSIRPENHRVESNKLIKPHYTVITNLRPDHLDVAGSENMWDIYRNDVFPGSCLLMPESETNGPDKNFISRNKLRLLNFKSTSLSSQNQVIATKLAEELGIPHSLIDKGIKNFRMDRGGLAAFEFEHREGRIIFVNAFSANDPYSSSLIMKETIRKLNLHQCPVAGLLSFQMDRGERSRQWLDYLHNGGKDNFDMLFFCGTHGRTVKRSLREGEILKSSDSQGITNEIIQNSPGICIVFGLVNIGGMGLQLAEYWEKQGKRIDL